MTEHPHPKPIPPIPLWRVGPFTVRRNTRDCGGVTISCGDSILHFTADQWDSLTLLVEDDIRRESRLGKLVVTPAKWRQ